MTEERVLEEIVYEYAAENQHQVSSEVSLHSRGYRYVHKLSSSLALVLSNTTHFFSCQFKIMQSTTMLQTKQKEALILNNKKRKWHFRKVPVVLSQWNTLLLVYFGFVPYWSLQIVKKIPVQNCYFVDFHQKLS